MVICSDVNSYAFKDLTIYNLSNYVHLHPYHTRWQKISDFFGRIAKKKVSKKKKLSFITIEMATSIVWDLLIILVRLLNLQNANCTYSTFRGPMRLDFVHVEDDHSGHLQSPSWALVWASFASSNSHGMKQRTHAWGLHMHWF